MSGNLYIFTFVIKIFKLHFIAPVFGIVEFFKNPKLCHIVLFLLSILLLNFLLIDQLDYFTYGLRAVQLVGLFLTFNFLIINSMVIDYVKGAKFVLICSVLILIVDILLERYALSSKFIFNIQIGRRYLGVSGEPNFSGFLLLVITLILFYYRSYRLVLLSIVTLFFTGSRASLLSLFLFVVLICFDRVLSQKMIKRLIVLIFLLGTLSSVFIGFSMQHLSKKNKGILKYASSERSELYKSYINLFFEAPLLGHGYTNSAAKYKKNPSKYGFHKPLEQHSLYLQILTDFGLILFTVIYFLLLRLLIILPNKIGIFLLPALMNISFINAINEPILYIYLAFIMNCGGINQKFFEIRMIRNILISGSRKIVSNNELQRSKQESPPTSHL